MQQTIKLINNDVESLEETLRNYPWFEEMRAKHPVLYDEEMSMWQVFRYEDALRVLTNHADFSSRIMSINNHILEDTVIATDPPTHRKLRHLVDQAFTPRALARLSGRINAITQELLDEVRARGKMDIVSDLAGPLPAKVIAEVLGTRDIFKQWFLENREDNARRSQIEKEISAYFAQLLQERRRTPREDLITSLSQAEVDGEHLSESELIHFCILLLAAGQETTKNLLANSILCLTDHPEMMEKLIREPELIPSAIEEVLRYLPPVWFIIRQTTREVELGGEHIPANAIVVVWIASANRDSAQFPDPERFDIQRAPNRHLGFGHGIHFCIGGPLARLETQIVLPMLLKQLKGLQRVEEVPIMISRGIVLVVQSLPITFEIA